MTDTILVLTEDTLASADVAHILSLHDGETLAYRVLIPADTERNVLVSLVDQLSLGDFAKVRPAIATYAATHGQYRPNRYALPPATAERVRRTWAPYFERYGYADQSVDAVTV